MPAEVLLKLMFFGLVLRPITVFLHELGHGIPALFLTKEKVSIYLGSYGNSKNSLKLNIRRFEFFLHKSNPCFWKHGLCIMHDQEVSTNRQIIITFFGPIVSLILALFFTYLIFYTNQPDDLIFIFFIFMLSSIYDFYINIVPSKKPIKLHNGTTVFNDGKQILNLLKVKNIPDEYNVGVKYYNNQEYRLAAIELEKVYKKGYREGIIYQLLISAYLQIKDYSNALRVNDLYNIAFKKGFNSNDYTNSGLIKSFSGAYNEALADYNKAIELDPKNSVAFNNRGYTFNVMEDYESAIVDFEEAISLEENFAYALNNRGFAKIKLGLKDEGLKDLEKSMNLDGTNSYCYLNFGIYHYDNGEYEKALEYYNKAKELDDKTYLLDEYIEKAKEKLSL